MTRFSPLRRTVVIALAAGAVACSTDAVSSVEPVLGRQQQDPVSTSTVTYGDTTVTVFYVDPAVSQAYSIGRVHKLWLVAGAICNPLTSSYGPAHWDEPCEPLRLPMPVTAKSWVDAKGHPFIDFSPNLRFQPVSAKRASAELFMKDKSASIDTTARILYCGPDGRCIDEALQDRSLATKYDTKNGFVYRKIKHFSGYMVTAGRE